MDIHFLSDLMVFVGYTKDRNLNQNTLCSTCDTPVIAAMSVVDPYYKWTVSAVNQVNARFQDIDISEDGKKVVAAGSHNSIYDYIILWVLDALTGDILNQSRV